MLKQKPTLNEADLDKVNEIVVEAITKAISENNKVIFSFMNQHFATKQDLQDLKKEFSHLPTKEEFYSKMDMLMGEVVKEREENEIQQSKLTDHEDRLTKVEAHLNLAA